MTELGKPKFCGSHHGENTKVLTDSSPGTGKSLESVNCREFQLSGFENAQKWEACDGKIEELENRWTEIWKG